jgi:hypothetical protein
MSTRFTDGNTTVTLDGAMEDLVRRALDAAADVRVLEDRASRVATGARSAWYAPGTGVTRRTGTSGDVETVTTVSETEVRVSIGSMDLAKAKYVHRPRMLSLTKVEVTREVYWNTPKKLRANYKPLKADAKKGRKADEGVGPYIWQHNPLASDGKFLLPELVRKPAAVALQEAIPALTAAFAAKVGGT